MLSGYLAMDPLERADEYEDRFMEASHALARERVRMAWWAHAALAFLAVWSFRATTLSHTIVQLLILAAVWLVCMTLRTVVTREAVHIQLGVFGPRIPLESIRSARAVTRSLLRTRGWGIRFGFDGSTTYNVPSTADGYVEISYERGGKMRLVRAMSHDPERLVAAIDRARAGTAARTGVRIVSSEPSAMPEEHGGTVMDDESLSAEPPSSRTHRTSS